MNTNVANGINRPLTLKEAETIVISLQESIDKTPVCEVERLKSFFFMLDFEKWNLFKIGRYQDGSSQNTLA